MLPQSTILFLLLVCAISFAEPQGNWRHLIKKGKNAKIKVPAVTSSAQVPGNGESNVSSNDTAHSALTGSPGDSPISTSPQLPERETTTYLSTSTTTTTTVKNLENLGDSNPQALDSQNFGVSQNSGSFSENIRDSPNDNTTKKYPTLENQQNQNASVIPSKKPEEFYTFPQNSILSSKNEGDSDTDYNVASSDIVGESWSIDRNNKVDSSPSQTASVNPVVPSLINSVGTGGSQQQDQTRPADAVTVATTIITSQNTNLTTFKFSENSTVSPSTANVENSSVSPTAINVQNTGILPQTVNVDNFSVPPETVHGENSTAPLQNVSIWNSNVLPSQTLEIENSGEQPYSVSVKNSTLSPHAENFENPSAPPATATVKSFTLPSHIVIVEQSGVPPYATKIENFSEPSPVAKMNNSIVFPSNDSQSLVSTFPHQDNLKNPTSLSRITIISNSMPSSQDDVGGNTRVTTPTDKHEDSHIRLNSNNLTIRNNSTLTASSSVIAESNNVTTTIASPVENPVIQISDQMLTETTISSSATTIFLVNSTQNPQTISSIASSVQPHSTTTPPTIPEPILTKVPNIVITNAKSGIGSESQPSNVMTNYGVSENSTEAVLATTPVSQTTTNPTTVGEATPKNTLNIAPDTPDVKSEDKSSSTFGNENKVKKKKNKHTAYYNKIAALIELRKKYPNGIPRTLRPRKLKNR